MCRLAQKPSLKARLELFTTDIKGLDMRWQRVGCHDTETARTITHTEYAVRSCHRCQRSKAGKEREQMTTGTQTSRKYALRAGDRPQMQSYVIKDDALRHGQSVKCVSQCWWSFHRTPVIIVAPRREALPVFCRMTASFW